ncbi:MAG: plasmid mobilization protein [Oscillospiraceae bacterium]
MTKREIEIKVRLNQKEAEHLNRQVEKCRLSREAYLRHLIAGVVPREAPPPEYFAFMRELHYVGNLLNQIAQKAHVLNVIDAKRYDEGSKQWEAFIRESQRQSSFRQSGSSAMATTSIWAVKGWLGKVVLYIENPEKTENPQFYRQRI